MFGIFPEKSSGKIRGDTQNDKIFDYFVESKSSYDEVAFLFSQKTVELKKKVVIIISVCDNDVRKGWFDSYLGYFSMQSPIIMSMELG